MSFGIMDWMDSRRGDAAPFARKLHTDGAENPRMGRLYIKGIASQCPGGTNLCIRLRLFGVSSLAAAE